MLELAASERELLLVARSIVGLGEPVPSLLHGETALSEPSPDCVFALRETLAKGCVHRLACGGWRRQDRVRDNARASGRIWERYDTAGLELTGATEALLRWMTAHSLVANVPALKLGPETPGDELFFYLAARAASHAGVLAALVKQPGVQRSSLCQLAFADQVALSKTKRRSKSQAVSSFRALAESPVLEALEDELASMWIEMECGKAEVAAGTEMIAIGAAQRSVLEALFDGIEAAGRRDLSKFAVVAAAALVDANSGAPSTEVWIKSLARTTKLSSRMEAREAASAFLDALERPAAWAATAKASHFIDDDYASSQILLEIWETLGPRRLEVLRAIRRDMTSIEAVTEDQTGGPS